MRGRVGTPTSVVSIRKGKPSVRKSAKLRGLIFCSHCRKYLDKGEHYFLTNNGLARHWNRDCKK